MSGLAVSYRALRALEVATYGAPAWAVMQVRDELVDLERGELLRVAATMAVEAQLHLTSPAQLPDRLHRVQETLLEVAWRMP